MKNTITKIALAFLVLNAAGLSYRNITFAQGAAAASVTDADGHTYRTIKIGSQTWMLENLRSTKYNDGTPIASIANLGDLKTSTMPGYAVHNSNESYGHMYNWYAVNTRKLAPKGWRVPSTQDWEMLRNYLGGQTVAGGKLKTGNGIDKQHSFLVFFAGYIAYNGRYTGVDQMAYWYSTTEGRGGKTGDSFRIEKTKETLHWGSFDKRFFMSVRCIKND